MQADFGRLCAVLKLILVQSQEDRPALASALLRQISFTRSMVAIQFRLILYRWGIGHLAVGGLLRVFEGVRLELNTLLPGVSVAA